MFTGNTIACIVDCHYLPSIKGLASETHTWLLYSLERDEISLFLLWIILHTLLLLGVCLSYIPSQQGRWENDSYCSLKHALWSGYHGNLLLWKPLLLPSSERRCRAVFPTPRKAGRDTHKYCDYKTLRVSCYTSWQANVKRVWFSSKVVQPSLQLDAICYSLNRHFHLYFTISPRNNSIQVSTVFKNILHRPSQVTYTIFRVIILAHSPQVIDQEKKTVQSVKNSKEVFWKQNIKCPTRPPAWLWFMLLVTPEQKEWKNISLKFWSALPVLNTLNIM